MTLSIGRWSSQERKWRRGPLLRIVPTRRKRPKTAEISELEAAAERLASALADVNEEQLVSEFKELRRRGKGASR
jgi:hypothetical protein